MYLGLLFPYHESSSLEWEAVSPWLTEICEGLLCISVNQGVSDRQAGCLDGFTIISLHSLQSCISILAANHN